ncbi:flagellar hook-basal body complex protein FliE [Lachnospiraceae bacterium ZAX-1]
MELASLQNLSSLSNISSDYIKNAIVSNGESKSSDQGFGTVLQSAMDMISETNQLQNSAESAEMQFMLGYATNTHDLQIAQSKANIALQYTVAVRDKFIESYKEIMNMQI